MVKSGENEGSVAIESAFAELEARAASEAPGVMDVIQVYGGYEAALRQVEAYLAATTPVPNYTVTNTTG